MKNFSKDQLISARAAVHRRLKAVEADISALSEIRDWLEEKMENLERELREREAFDENRVY